jgi:AraC-like DNA-binding protein
MIAEFGRTTQAPYAIFPYRKDHGDDQVLAVQDWIETHCDQNFNYEDLARRSGMSRRTMERRFKSATGETPLTYQQGLRVEAAKRLLEQGPRSFDEITYAVGYEDASTFRKIFSKQTGLLPSSSFLRCTEPRAARTDHVKQVGSVQQAIVQQLLKVIPDGLLRGDVGQAQITLAVAVVEPDGDPYVAADIPAGAIVQGGDQPEHEFGCFTPGQWKAAAEILADNFSDIQQRQFFADHDVPAPCGGREAGLDVGSGHVADIGNAVPQSGNPAFVDPRAILDHGLDTGGIRAGGQ